MTNTTHTIVCLHIFNSATNEHVYITGFLIRNGTDETVIAQTIHQATGVAYQEILIKTVHIKQRYDLPLTFW